MEALISAQNGLAVLVDDAAVLSIHAEAPDRDVPRQSHEVRWLLGGAEDVIVLEDARRDEVVERLFREQKRQLALMLVSCVLNGNPVVSKDIRMEAAEELEELLHDHQVDGDLRDVLWSVAAAPSADFEGPLRWLGETTLKTTQLVRDLSEAQAHIVTVRRAWDALPKSLFEGGKDSWKQQAIQLGLFRRLVGKVQEGQAVNLFLVEAGTDPQIQRLENHRAVLQDWVVPWVHARSREDTVAVASAEKSKTRSQSKSKSPKARRKGRKANRKSRAQIRADVESMKQRVLRELEKGRFSQAIRLVGELVDFQEHNGGPEFAVKSLCDLAQKAKDLGSNDLHLRWSQQAVEVSPQDGWAWAQLGQAYLHLGEHDRAQEAFARAVQFGKDAVGRVGSAEVLKSLGRYEEALSAYASIQASHPSDVVAKTGYAEVLKSLGRYEEVFSAYASIQASYPENVVAKNGHAEVLKSLGRYEEALSAYASIQASHPENVFAKNGHAEVLKSLGRYEEALSAYASIQASHPENVVAKNGHAEVLKSLGRYEEALSAYASIQASHPSDVVAKNGHAEVLKSLGRYEEALSAYEGITEVRPEDKVARNGYASTLMLVGRWDEALDRLPDGRPSDLQDWIGWHIRGMVFLRTNRLEEAKKVFQQGVEECPSAESREIFRRTLALTCLKLEQSKEALEWARECDPAAMPSNIILFQAAVKEHEEALAQESYARILKFPTMDRELQDELGRRLNAISEQDDEWVFERSWRLLAVA